MSGKAIIVRDAELRAKMAVNGKPPEHVLVVEITRVLSHCPKCLIRSGMGQPDAWRDASNLPSFAEVLIAHAKPGTVEQTQVVVDKGNRERLY